MKNVYLHKSIQPLFLATLLVALSPNALSVSDEIRYDMLMNRLVEQVEDKKHLDTLKTISELKTLSSNLPSYLSYFEGKALYESGQKAKAYEVLLDYVTKHGKQADYYDKSISYLSKSEGAYQAKQAEKEAAIRKEQQRKQALIAKRLAEAEKAKQAERQKVIDYMNAKRRAKGFNERYLEHYTDKSTGLQWTMPIAEKYGYNKTISSVAKKNYGNYNVAKNYCANLILDGHTDWQIPTAVHLDFMSNKLLDKMREKDDYRYRIWFAGDKRFKKRSYDKRQRTNSLYIANLSNAKRDMNEPPTRYQHYEFETNTNVKKASVACVRESNPAQFSAVQKNEYDIYTAQSPRPTKYMIHNTYFLPNGLNFRAWTTYKHDGLTVRAAKNRCEDMELGGYDDWRLPTKEETIQLHRNKFASSQSLTYPYGDDMCFYGSEDSGASMDDDNDFTGGGLSDEIGIAQNIGGKYSGNVPILYTSAQDRSRITMNTEMCNYYCIRKVND